MGKKTAARGAAYRRLETSGMEKTGLLCRLNGICSGAYCRRVSHALKRSFATRCVIAGENGFPHGAPHRPSAPARTAEAIQRLFWQQQDARIESFLKTCYNSSARLSRSGGMADTRDLKSLARKGVCVRVASSAPVNPSALGAGGYFYLENGQIQA